MEDWTIELYRLHGGEKPIGEDHFLHYCDDRLKTLAYVQSLMCEPGVQRYVFSRDNFAPSFLELGTGVPRQEYNNVFGKAYDDLLKIYHERKRAPAYALIKYFDLHPDLDAFIELFDGEKLSEKSHRIDSIEDAFPELSIAAKSI